MYDIQCDCSTDFDHNDIYHVKVLLSRKQHQCCECDQIIPTNTQYENVDALTNGTWWHAKTCLTCVAIRNRYCPNGRLHEGLRETLYECLGFNYTSVPDCDDDEDGPSLKRKE